MPYKLPHCRLGRDAHEYENHGRNPRKWLFRHRRAVIAWLIVIATLVCCAIFYPSYLEGTIPISSQALAELDLEKLRNDYRKLGESGLYQMWEPEEGELLASITNMGADNKTVRIFIYREMRSPDDPNLMKHTAYYRRSGIMDALYGLKPLGTCYSFFTLESNDVVIWIADYRSNGTAVSLENDLRRITDIVNNGEDVSLIYSPS